MLRGRVTAWMPPPYLAGADGNPSVSRIGYFLAVATVALVFSRLIEFLPDFVTVLHPGILLMGFGAAIAVLSGGIARAAASRVTLFVVLFTGWAMAGLPFSVWRSGALRTFVFFWITSLLAYFTIASMIVTVEQCRKAMLALATAILVVLLLGLFRGSDEGARQLGRFAYDYGTLRNQNILAMILLMGLPFCAMAYQHWHGPRRVLAGGGLALIGISIFRTGSRAGLVALGVLLLLMFWRASVAGKIKLVMVAAVLSPLAVAVSTEGALARFKFMLWITPQATRPVSRAEATAIDSTISRAALLHRSLVETAHHPVLGVGMGQFMVADSNAAREERRKASWRVTHNAYTQLSSETGIPGLLFYSGAMWVCFRRLRAVRQATRGHAELTGMEALAQYLRLSLIAYAVCALFDSTAYECYFPILAALTVALDAAAKREIGAWQSRAQPAAAPAPVAAARRRAMAV